MNEKIYPLGHSQEELERLDRQALLIHDSILDKLAANSKSCLEIGCGCGSNVPLLKKINPLIHYLGVDISHEAIETAKMRFSTKDTDFLVVDAVQMNIKKNLILSFQNLFCGPSVLNGEK